MRRMNDIVSSMIKQYSVFPRPTAAQGLVFTGLLGCLGLEAFLQKAFGMPDGYFDQAKTELHPRMVNMLRGKGKPIAILPYIHDGDSIDYEELSFVARILWGILGVPVRFLNFRELGGAFVKDGVLDGDWMIDYLSAEMEIPGTRGKDNSAIIALTNMETKTTKHGPVFGYAGMRIPVAVVTTHGMGDFRSGDPLPWRRLLRVVLHELGHTYGVPHCKEPTCVMRAVPQQGGVDAMGFEYCSICMGRILVVSDRVTNSIWAKKEKQPILLTEEVDLGP